MDPILIRGVEHRFQRYPTVGDWYTDLSWGPSKIERCTVINVSRLRNWRYMVLIAVHELVEWACCKAHGVTEAAVDRFDFAYDGDDPGSDRKAPYHREHVFATKVERMLAKELGVDWAAYERALDRLTKGGR